MATHNEAVKTKKKLCGTATSNYFLCCLESIGVSPENRTDILTHLLENPLIPLHDNFATIQDHVTSEEEEESADEQDESADEQEESADEQEESADEEEESADEQTADPPSWAEDEYYFPDGITPCVEGTVSRAGLGFL